MGRGSQHRGGGLSHDAADSATPGSTSRGPRKTLPRHTQGNPGRHDRIHGGIPERSKITGLPQAPIEGQK